MTSRRSPGVAAFLSFLWPGLGQLFSGRRVWALLFALPAVAVTLPVVYEAWAQGPVVFLARFAVANLCLLALALIVVVGLLRIASVVHAYFTADRSRVRGRFNVGILAVLLVAIVGMHGVGGLVAWDTYQFDTKVFSSDEFTLPPDTSDSPGASVSVLPKPTEMPTPSGSPTPKSARITILLIGLDLQQSHTDSMIVASIDPDTKQVSMVSVPRDTSQFPLYWGGTAPAIACGTTFKLNYFMKFAVKGCFPAPDPPMRALENEVGYLVGVHIDYWAEANFAGFSDLVNHLPAGNGQPKGKLCVTNPNVISDATYDWPDSDKFGFYLSAGYHCLDGRNTLAYARDRHGYDGGGNNDYKRSSRQQQVLVELFKRVKTEGPGDLLQFEHDVAGVIHTDFPPEKVSEMVALGQDIPPSDIDSYVLAPPKYTVSGVYCLKLDQVALLSVQLYGEDSRYYHITQPPNCGS